jgi:hypothetical protein
MSDPKHPGKPVLRSQYRAWYWEEPIRLLTAYEVSGDAIVDQSQLYGASNCLIEASKRAANREYRHLLETSNLEVVTT